jgi:hypothetical protein
LIAITPQSLITAATGHSFGLAHPNAARQMISHETHAL